MKQTAVEFLEKEFDKFIEWDINGDPIFIVNDVNKIWDAFEQALELEMEQIMQTYKIAQVNVMLNSTEKSEQYYFETYKKPKK
jgi:hypothetical protein